MEYRKNRSIFLQIADHMCEKIIRGEWHENDRILSIREMAVETEVNPNTVTRTYGYLQEKGIIFNRRGIGYFVNEGSEAITKKMVREEFIRTELPYIFGRMNLLGISIDDLETLKNTANEGLGK
jgi:GntR family transcriptional regulator